jgi:hypothetical protein
MTSSDDLLAFAGELLAKEGFYGLAGATGVRRAGRRLRDRVHGLRGAGLTTFVAAAPHGPHLTSGFY